MKVESADPKDLLNHPLSIKLYGDKVEADFVRSIRDESILHPIVLAADGRTVVSGHRRRNAARILKLKTVPVIIRRDLKEPEQIARAIVEANRQRVKTPEMLSREAITLAELAGETGQKAKSFVAEALECSERTAQDLITTGRRLEEAERTGDTETAERVRNAKSASGARRATTRERATPFRQRIRAVTQLIEKLSREIDTLHNDTPANKQLKRKIDQKVREARAALEEWLEEFEKSRK